MQAFPPDSPSSSTPRADAHRTVDARPHLSAHLADLVAALRRCDPLRSSFDRAVRHFVRVERHAGQALDQVLDDLRAVLAAHVEPELPWERRAALRTAVEWFAVSEYHRAD